VGRSATEAGTGEPPVEKNASHPDAPATPPNPARRGWEAATSRPLASVAALGLVVAALNVWWVATHRHLGAFTVDEVGYMATALRAHRALDPAHPLQFIDQAFRPSATGPLVPALAVPLLVVGSRSVTTVLATQALIGVVAAVAAAGCALRIAGRSAALVSGVVVLALPGMVGSARSFQFAAALGAFMLLGLWALLSSDRGHRRSAMVAFGAAVGAMLLARTMAVGFVPGMALAALIIVRRDRRGLVNAGLAACTALVVAGPWWYASRQALQDYLFRFGYGDRATEFGGSNVAVRAASRSLTLLGDIRLPFLLLGAVTVGVITVDAVRHRRAAGSLRDWPAAERGVAAVAAPSLLGAAALMSTANLGVWFELPLTLPAVVAVVSAARLIDRPVTRTLATIAVVTAAVTFLVSLTDRGGAYNLSEPRGFGQALLFGGLEERQPDVGKADPRLRSNDPAVQQAAALEWWDTTVAVNDRVKQLQDESPDLVLTQSGSSQLFNGQSLRLATELGSLTPLDAREPDTGAPAETLMPQVEPFAEGRRRVLLLMFPEAVEPFPADRQVDRLAAFAADADWRPTQTFRLPDGGSVSILDHPVHGG
jgi:4-amino-4-deoxy-L-arabinose transferase-like glycosyltransferase